MAENGVSSEMLKTRIAEATQYYAVKNYTQAADAYSQATSLQADINGEMAPENADLLYAYGRCLYHVAVGKSDVLGGRVVGNGGGDKARGKKRKAPAVEDEAGKVAEAMVEHIVEQKDGTTKAQDTNPPAKSKDAKQNTPYFQIEGDDADWNSDDSEDVEDVEGEPTADDDAPDEEEDDFAIAYEVLDIARVLLTRKLDTLNEQKPDTSKGKGKAKASADQSAPPTGPARQIQELLADTYDLQAEISLENERFPDAATDSKASLALKQQLYPRDSSIIAEAHFKVSLALEFAAKTTTEKTDELAPAAAEDVEGVDEEMRKESAKHMDLAIESTRLRVQRETKELASAEEEQREEKRKGIEDVKEMIADMEQRLSDLRAPTLTLNAAVGNGFPNTATSSDQDPLGGILGSLLGETPAAQRARIEEATRGANDLTSMVRQKKKPASVETSAGTNGAAGGVKASPVATNGRVTRGKRAAAEIAGNELGTNGSKRAKVEDAEEDELA